MQVRTSTAGACRGLHEHFEAQRFVNLSSILSGSTTVVVGEVVATMQGWTEGAIQSVNAAVKALRKHAN